MCPSRELGGRKPSVWRPWEQKKKLQSHIAPDSFNVSKHSSSTPPQCNICLTSFKRDSELRRHKNSKHLSKHELCTICGKVFTRKDNLTRHIKAHNSGEKPSCQFCSKVLSRRDAVQRHESRCPKNPTRKSSRMEISHHQEDDDEEESYDNNTFPTHMERLSLKHPELTATTSDEDGCFEDDDDSDSSV